MKIFFSKSWQTLLAGIILQIIFGLIYGFYLYQGAKQLGGMQSLGQGVESIFAFIFSIIFSGIALVPLLLMVFKKTLKFGGVLALILAIFLVIIHLQNGKVEVIGIVLTFALIISGLQSILHKTQFTIK